MSETDEERVGSPAPSHPDGAGLTVDYSDAISALTDREAVRCLSGRSTWIVAEVPGTDLGEMKVADGPHGLRCQADHGDHVGLGASKPATCFPPAVTLAASWDAELVEEVGAAVGVEAIDQGVSVVLGPGLNLKRHPAGGRNFEYFSEDPLLSGRLAGALVRGLQSRGVGGCLKHFAANNHEAYRFVADAIIDPRTLREFYLRGFEIAVRESRPWTVMCAYNQLNGVYCSENRWLLTDVLRDDWGFDGVVMSDWGATNNRAEGVRAGLELQMPGCKGAFDDQVIQAVGASLLDRSDIDTAVTRLVDLQSKATATRRRNGAFGADTAQWVDDHDALARRAAVAGTVLLTNDGILPLSPDTTLAVIGGAARTPRFQGAGSSQVNPTKVSTIFDATVERVGRDRLDYVQALDPTDGSLVGGGLDRALAAARRVDIAVIVATLPPKDESEGFDRDHLDLPPDTVALIEAVCDVQPRTVVVLANGAPITTPWAGRPAAIVESYLGGQAGGAATVDVLFGDAEPGGRLAESFPTTAAQLPADRNFPGGARRTEYREQQMVGYRAHTTFDSPAAFAFGHGLSYTTWGIDVAQPDSGELPATVEVTITNTGARPGSQVVQVYVDPIATAVERPATILAGWVKVTLDAGGSDTVSIAIDPHASMMFDVSVDRFVVDPGKYRVRVATSVVDTVTSFEVDVPAGPDGDRPDARWSARGLDAAVVLQPTGTVPPRRPFHRNSTIADVVDTPLGPVIKRLVAMGARRELNAEFAEVDEGLMRMYERVVLEMPLRAFVALGNGAVSMAQVDSVIDMLNGRWSLVGRRAVSTMGDVLRGAAGSVRGRIDRSPGRSDAGPSAGSSR